MLGTESIREKLRATDGSKIVRTWTSSRWTYGADSKDRTPNPDYHRAICQRESGKYTDLDDNVLPVSEVPAYIREQGRPQRMGAADEQVHRSMAEVMQDEMAANRRADEPTPESRRRKAPSRKRASKRAAKPTTV